MSEGILAKALAVLLTLGQLKNPAAIKLEFNPETDRAQAVLIMRESCQNLMVRFKEVSGQDLTQLGRKEGDGQSNTDTIKTVINQYIEGAKAMNQSTELFKGIDAQTVSDIYLEICKGEPVANSQAPIRQAMEFYNKAIKGTPAAGTTKAVPGLPTDDDIRKLKGKKLKQSSIIYDYHGNKFTEYYKDDNRRIVMPLARIPEKLRKAFIAIEDRRFPQHKGIDELGLMRAFAKNIMSGGRPQGASTITQQVIKNVMVGDDVSFERKIKEMIVASKVEAQGILSKDEILELYLNYIFLGRSSWGVEMASQSYFNKSVDKLTLSQMALLAGLTHGPNRYVAETPEAKEAAVKRRNEVLDSMVKEKFITDAEAVQAKAEVLKFEPFESPRNKAAFYFLDQVNDSAKVLGKVNLDESSFKIKTTLHPKLQKITEAALQEGLWAYENKAGRSVFEGAEGNIAAALQAKPGSTWQSILATQRKPLYDVHWELAVITQISGGKAKVGFKNGGELPLVPVLRSMKQYDLVFVKPVYRRSKQNNMVGTAQLRVRPDVQGAAVVLENKTGKILALTGGFSFPLSQFNRASMFAPAARQAGSTAKPFVYLSALSKGYQPNTILIDQAQTYMPPGGRGKPWTPLNYDRTTSGYVTLRRALERSLNVPTARWLDVLEPSREQSLGYIRSIMQDVGLYKEPINNYSLLLGAGATRLVDMAVAYATIANHGMRPQAHVIESVEESTGNKVNFPVSAPQATQVADPVAFVQLKKILQGVLSRGTARSISELSEATAGKTGTTDSNTNTWFAGFSNDLTIVIWVGYDDKKIYPSLGGSATGGSVAVPIFDAIYRGSIDYDRDDKGQPKRDSNNKEKYVYAPASRLVDPDAQTARLMGTFNTDLNSGNFGDNFVETFRLMPDGRTPINTQHHIVGGGIQPSFAENPQDLQQPGPPMDITPRAQAQQAPGFNAPNDNELFPPIEKILPNRPPRNIGGPDEDPNDRFSRQPRRVDPFFQPFFEPRF